MCVSVYETLLQAASTLPRPCCPGIKNKAEKRRLCSHTSANKTLLLAIKKQERAGEMTQQEKALIANLILDLHPQNHKVGRGN